MPGGVEQLSTDYQMCNREQIPESNALSAIISPFW